MNKLLRRTCIAAASTLLALLGVEAGVRVLAPQPLHPLTKEPLLRGEFVKPGDHAVKTREYVVSVHVNKDGFVDDEWGEKREGVPRVIVLGDSYIQAAQVSLRQGFGRVLDRELEALLGREVEVLSMGVPGAGTATELGVLLKHALPRNPDLVILGFLLANDVLNNHPLLEEKPGKPFYTLREGRLEPVDAVDVLVPEWATGLPWRLSATWRLVARRLLERRSIQRKIALGKGIPIDLRVHDPAADPVWDEAWSVTEALIGEMAKRCAEAGVGFGILLLPDALQVSEPARRTVQEFYPVVQGWDFSRAGDRASARFGETAPVFDLRPSLSLFEERLYYSIDGHWNVRGHREAATASAPFVASLLTARGVESSSSLGTKRSEPDLAPGSGSAEDQEQNP